MGTAFRLIPCHYNGRLPAFLLLSNLYLLVSILEFQSAAPGGYSAFPAHPAHTYPGLAVSSAGPTRSHPCLL